MDSVSETATEAVAEVAEEVAEQATNVAEISRGLSGRDLGLVFGGVVLGAGLGGVLTFVFTRKRLETKYNQIAEEEIAGMREHFRAKLVARDEKPTLSELAQEHQELVKEQGYVDRPPMAVAPPTEIVEEIVDAPEEEEEDDETLRIETLAEHRARMAEEQNRNVFEDARVDDDWDWHAERQKRSPTKPYVIHVDEREASSYDGVTYTYYEADDVLTNERDDVIPADERNLLVGDVNLDKFGHGSNDPYIVYIRNDRLEMDMEIIRNEGSYEQEVLGFDPPEIKHGDRRRGRLRFDDESPSG